MGVGKQRNISLNPWIKDAVEELAKREGKSFPSIVNQLLTVQLELEGFSEGAYIAKQRGRSGGQIPDITYSRPPKAGLTITGGSTAGYIDDGVVSGGFVSEGGRVFHWRIDGFITHVDGWGEWNWKG